jgi:hypothetical protein
MSIRIVGARSVDTVFNEQQVATMEAFGSSFHQDEIRSCCDAIVTRDDDSQDVFCCTRENGHDGFHIAVGTRVVAVFDVDDILDHEIDGVQF